MKRRKFIMGTMAVVPVTAFGSNKKAQRNGNGLKIKSGEGRIHGHIQLKGVNSNILDVKISGKDTAGALAIFEQTSLSPKRGTPLHLHHFQEEIFYVIDGEYQFQVGQEKYNLKPGDSIFLPRKVPHAWAQISEKGRMLVTLQPAGKLEEFFVAMAALKNTPTPEEIAKIFENHEMSVVGPPLRVD